MTRTGTVQTDVPPPFATKKRQHLCLAEDAGKSSPLFIVFMFLKVCLFIHNRFRPADVVVQVLSPFKWDKAFFIFIYFPREDKSLNNKGRLGDLDHSS